MASAPQPRIDRQDPFLFLLEAVRDRETQFRAIFEYSVDAILIADDTRRYVDANPAGCELLGVSRDEISNFRIDDFTAPALRPQIEQVWQSFLAGGEQKGEYELYRFDGTVRHIEYSARANFIPRRHLSCIRDVTDRKRIEENLRQLSARLLALQDEERRHISRELHDSVGQALSAVSLDLSAWRTELQASHPAAAAGLGEDLELIRQTADELRTMSYLLHPPLLDERGLVSALRWYLDGLAERSNVRVNLEVPAHWERLGGEMEIALFRTLQECLTNIIRHASSPTAAIRLNRSHEAISLEIADQGRGIPPERLREIARAGTAGIGLQGIRERIKAFAGELEITSTPKGTCVRVKIPLNLAEPQQQRLPL